MLQTNYTPIYMAAEYGHTEIVKILAPLTDNPDAPNNKGVTLSSVAKNVEIRRIIESFKIFQESVKDNKLMPLN